MSSNLINIKEIRKFGVIGFLFFGALFVVAIWRDKVMAAYFFGLLALPSIGFILLPVRLKPVYAAWLKIGHFLASKVTVFILTIMFFFVITPAAFLKRIFGGRPLPLKPDLNAKTYWVTRPESVQPKGRFPKRY